MERAEVVRGLRIAVSAVFGILCVLLILLWVHGISMTDSLVANGPAGQFCTVVSTRGGIAFGSIPDFKAFWQVSNWQSESGPNTFVGLSKIRNSSALDGVPLADRREQLKCGVAAVDLRSGQVIAFLEFQTAVEEIFDMQLMPGLRIPAVIEFQHETIQHTFVVPLAILNA